MRFDYAIESKEVVVAEEDEEEFLRKKPVKGEENENGNRPHHVLCPEP